MNLQLANTGPYLLLMERLLVIPVCIALLASGRVEARSEYQLGGQGNPWKAALSTEAAGEYAVLDAEGNILRTVNVGATPHGAGTDTLIDFSDTAIKPRFIDPSVNMTLTDPTSSEIKIPLPYIGGQALTTDGCSALDDQIRAVKRQFDGDLTTAHFRRFTQDPNSFPGVGEGWGRLGSNAVVVDLGAAVPVNRIRFYPRLGREDDALLIQELTAPKPQATAFGEDSFAENFLAWYEIRVGDNSKPFARSPCDIVSLATRGLNFVTPSDNRLEIFRTTRENLDVVVDLKFPTRSLRWITLRPFPLRNWEVAEFEVYGEGFVEQTAYISQILDFGRPINWGKIRWTGQIPEGTRVEIRTRTGSTPDPNLYFDENVNGDIVQISRADYEKIDPTGRRPPVYDAANWSFWSPPYNFRAGERDARFAAGEWKDGTPLLSPGPSRYIQIAIRFFASFNAAPSIDELTLQFSESPSARELVGEIWPIQVETFAPTPFTYVVRPAFDAQDTGFDRLEILTHVRVENVHSLSIDGQQVSPESFPPEIQDDRILLSFPRLQGEADSFKQLEVAFDVPVLRFGTEFSSWVFDSEDADRIRQQVKPGNATFRFSGDALAVQTPVGGRLLVDVQVGPNPFTPNGDGINDVLRVAYKLREVTAERPIAMRIYDLAGRLVVELPPILGRSGQFANAWDGRDGAGQQVPPGTYIYRLTLEAEDRETRTGALSVAY